MDVMEFFQRSTGRWRSQRTTHHLAFKRTETGEFEIRVESLPADYPQLIDICHLHNIDPAIAIGGAFVAWKGEMAWDKEGDNNDGTTLFVLVPDPDSPRQGQLLRDQGYAEKVPVAGHYRMDADDALVLATDYEITNSLERFWFASPTFRLRTSTVQRMGGFTTATFCTELRLSETSGVSTDSQGKLQF